MSLNAPFAPHEYKYAQISYLSAVDDRLEARSTQSVDGESRHWNGDATPQAHMAGNVWCVG